MINSRSLSDLAPAIKAIALVFITECAGKGIDILVTSTYRDKESQDALYARGRTTPGNIVTNAKGGESFHQYRCAFDFCPLVNGKPVWDDIALFEQCGQIGESVGLEWAGRWEHMKELAHLQFTAGLSLADLQSGKTLP